MLSWVALLGLAMGTMPAGSDGPVKKYDGGWDLYKNDDNCALLRSYAGDTILRIAYYPKEDTARVSVVDGQLKGVVDGGSYKFQLYFVNGDAIDKGWGTVNFKGIKFPDLGSGYKFAVSGKTFLADMGKNRLMGIMDGDTVVESLKLDSLSDALVGLEACSLGVG
ncbi:MAG: hypothetical protein JSR79_06175 [Proteobacteria bacterium]|nr:hypothetical protein [Pseudomonadota bacterium]